MASSRPDDGGDDIFFDISECGGMLRSEIKVGERVAFSLGEESGETTGRLQSMCA